MKIYEVMQNMLDVEDANDKEITLVDPKTKVKTVVPRDPNKPGMIKRDQTGNLKLSTDQNKPQEVDSEIKRGDKVQVG